MYANFNKQQKLAILNDLARNLSQIDFLALRANTQKKLGISSFVWANWATGRTEIPASVIAWWDLVALKDKGGISNLDKYINL